MLIYLDNGNQVDLQEHVQSLAEDFVSTVLNALQAKTPYEILAEEVCAAIDNNTETFASRFLMAGNNAEQRHELWMQNSASRAQQVARIIGCMESVASPCSTDVFLQHVDTSANERLGHKDLKIACLELCNFARVHGMMQAQNIESIVAGNLSSDEQDNMLCKYVIDKGVLDGVGRSFMSIGVCHTTIPERAAMFTLVLLEDSRSKKEMCFWSALDPHVVALIYDLVVSSEKHVQAEMHRNVCEGLQGCNALNALGPRDLRNRLPTGAVRRQLQL